MQSQNTRYKRRDRITGNRQSKVFSYSDRLWKKDPKGEKQAGRNKKRETMANSGGKKQTSTIVWGSNPDRFGLASTEKFVADRSWIKTYEHQAPNYTRFVIKAGSKAIGLDSFDSSLNEEAKHGELQVFRKYS